MFEICPACGKYSDGMLVEQGKIRCPACGNAAPFVQRPQFFLTGASGVGKSTAARILFDTRKEYVTLECDILWRDFFNTPQDGYADFRDTWLRLAANVSQYGKSAVLCGCVTPEQIQARPRKRYFSELHFIGVVCSEAEMARRMGMDPKEEKPVEFDFTDHRFIDAYFSVLHHPMEDKGVDFWWIDWQQGTRSRMEGLDPLWSLNHYHYLDSRRHPEALILSRYAGIGSHRYPVGFSGDTFISWETMKIMPLFTSSAANTGFGWWSHDIGGHMQGVKDNELYLRFVQFGVFSPVSRLHGTSHPLLHKEPEFFGNGTGLIAARFLRLRHAMIPMLHSASIRMSDTGLQLIEPMYYAWPEDENAYQAPGQYLFGQTMIAAPVTSPLGPDGLCVQHVYLPEGRWTDVFTGQEYRGGWHDMARDLDSFPLLARSGSFFVLDSTRRPHEQENLTDLPASLRVLIFSGNGSYSLLEDAPGFTHRAVTTWNIREDGAWQELTIDVEDPDSFLPGRSMDLEFRNVREAEVTAFAGNMPLDVRSRSISLGTLVHVPDVRAGERVTIRIREKSSPWQKHLFRLADTLSRLEMDNTQKDMLYRRLLSCTNPLDAEGTLSVHPVQDAFRTAIMECFADGAEMDETDALPN